MVYINPVKHLYPKPKDDLEYVFGKNHMNPADKVQIGNDSEVIVPLTKMDKIELERHIKTQNKLMKDIMNTYPSLHPCIPVHQYTLKQIHNKKIMLNKKLSKLKLWIIRKILKWEIKKVD